MPRCADILGWPSVRLPSGESTRGPMPNGPLERGPSDLPRVLGLDLRLARSGAPDRAGGGIGRRRPPTEAKGDVMRAPVVGVVAVALVTAAVLAPASATRPGRRPPRLLIRCRCTIGGRPPRSSSTT